MAPSVSIVVAMFHLSSATQEDEQSLLQMPVIERTVATDNNVAADDCACPGYIEEQCTANAFQGCIWEPADGSNAPWCACDPNFVPTPPLFTNLGNEEPVDGDLRLVGSVTAGRATAGRLEIYHEGVWGTICDDHFGEEEAVVACRQLGFTGSDPIRTSYQHGDGDGPILLDDLACTTDHERIDQCPNRGGWGSHNCAHHEDVGLICAQHTPEPGDPADGDLRLADGTSTRGRLEIAYQGVWGTICDDAFNAEADATVACQQLGFDGAVTRYTAGGGSGPIWLDDIACTSDHIRIEDCSHRGWGRENCGHGEDVGVDCFVADPVEEEPVEAVGSFEDGHWAAPVEWIIGATSSYSSTYSPDQLKIHDGEPWHTESSSNVWRTQNLIFDAGSEVTLAGFSTTHPRAWITASMNEFVFSASHDGSTYHEVLAGNGANLAAWERQEFQFPAASARYWKLAIISNHGYGACAIQYMEFRIISNEASVTDLTGFYRIQQKLNDKYLDAHTSSQSSGDTNVVTRDRQANPTQFWWVEARDLERQAYSIQQVGYNDGSTPLMTYMDAFTSDNSGIYDYRIVMRDNQNNPSQKWIFTPVGDAFTIQQQENLRYMDAYESGQCVTRTEQGNDSQKWILTPLEGSELPQAQDLKIRR